MRQRWPFLIIAFFLFSLTLLASLSVGAKPVPFETVFLTFTSFDTNDYAHAIVWYQRWPRALIAVYVGAVMACAGCVLQGLTRNPLSSPTTLGINSGAAMFVVIASFVFGMNEQAQGYMALAGALFGFFSCLLVVRLVGLSQDPRRLVLILSGALIGMLYLSAANALLLSDPELRSNFLGWLTGNLNHAYAGRLFDYWWIGASALALLFGLARPLTLIVIGEEKAASAGVNVVFVCSLAFMAVAVSAGSAVAICGPLGFVGLIVPHIVRPFVGTSFIFSLPACAVTGATACLLADFVARFAFAPYVVHTGVILDLVGGLVFAWIVKRYYLARNAGSWT
ncbi:MAG: iron ABC transporter permease [Pseudomonadota bacterium]